MKQIELNASEWSTPDDFFEALLSELGAPGWHGHNLNALWDSVTSDINEVMPPFTVVVRRADNRNAELSDLFKRVSEVFSDARGERGLEVWFDVG